MYSNLQYSLIFINFVSPKLPFTSYLFNLAFVYYNISIYILFFYHFIKLCWCLSTYIFIIKFVSKKTIIFLSSILYIFSFKLFNKTSLLIINGTH